MTETEFIESIDCSFPYNSEAEWRPLIELGTSISPNAAFMVLHELCRPPTGIAVPKARIEAILDCWNQHFKHPLVGQVLPAAKAMIDGQTIAVDTALRTMRVVAAYRGQYNALSIPYFACDDVDGRAEELRLEITNAWAGA